MPMRSVVGPEVETIEAVRDLELALSDRTGRPCKIVDLQRASNIYNTSHVLDELDIRLDDGRSLQLMLKDLSPRSRLEQARQVKPSFLDDPLREIEVYRDIL